jgi:NAD(P)H-dependent FMN reductase
VNSSRPLSIPVILGTTRKGRLSAHAAHYILERIRLRSDVTTELLDIAGMSLRTDDAGEDLKDPGISEKLAAADALVIVSPEYNHSFPGLLKHVVDSYLKEYIHKAAGIVGVSAGSFAGARVVEHFLPVLRELGLVTIFWDVNVGPVSKAFAENGALLDEHLTKRVEKFLDELVWMARTLRYGRENIALN